MFRDKFFLYLLPLGLVLASSVCQSALAQKEQPRENPSLKIRAYLEHGKLEEAERLLLSYAIANPNDAQTLELFGQLRYQQGRVQEAQSLFQRVVVLDPGSVRAKLSLAQLTFELGDKEGSLSLVNEVSKRSLTVPERLALAATMVQVGEFQGALRVIEKLPPAGRNGPALALKAASYFALADRTNLLALLPAIKRTAAVNPDIAAHCAEVLQQAGLFKDALDVSLSALPRTPGNPRLLLLAAQAETKLGNFAAAKGYLDRAAKTNSSRADILFALGVLQSAQGNSEAALASLKQARALAPRSTAILAEFVVNAMRANRPEEATEAAAELVQLGPGNPEYLYLLGASSLQNRNLAVAQRSLEKFREQRPRDSRGCLALGLTFSAQSDYKQQAKAQFEDCLRLEPKDVESKYQLAMILKAEGQIEQATTLLQDVAASVPHANALRELASIYLQSGAEAKARELLERAVAINPDDAETHFQLSRAYSLTGENVLARQHLNRFKELKAKREKPSNP